MALEEAVNLPCPFAGQERAHGIDYAPARTHDFGCDVEKPLL
jgi:hypothetical protein